jgi:signal transduction histidine kinase
MLDITERKIAEDAIKVLNMLKQPTRPNQNFGQYSHEIRTPLNGIIGFTDLLLKTKLEEIQEKHDYR